MGAYTVGEMDEILRLTREVGGVSSTVGHLTAGQARITEDLDKKHRENRLSIHALSNKMQEFVESIEEKIEKANAAFDARLNKIEIKVAVGASIGGLLAAVGSHYIDKLFK